MKTIMARYDAGRWLVDCPIHGKDGAVLAQSMPEISPLWAESGLYICPVCHPGIKSQLVSLRRGVFSYRFDESARRTARKMAEEQDEIYQVTFPENKDEIEFVLKDRPLLMRHWDGEHETIEFLKSENELIDAMMRR